MNCFLFLFTTLKNRNKPKSANIRNSLNAILPVNYTRKYLYGNFKSE